MECNHERIKSVNCRIFCDICGAELPADYLKNKHPEPVTAAETPTEGQKRTRKRKAVE